MMWEIFLENLYATTWLEWVVFISLTLYVFLAARQNPLAWPVSMMGVAGYFIIALQARLYAELPLQVFYFVVSIYGFYLWKYGGKKRTALPVTRLTPRQYLGFLGLGIVATYVAGLLLLTYTDTDVPFWDAGTTVFSLLGTWMQARKKLENWLVWLGVDAVYVGLFIYKTYYLISFLNIIYIGVAGYGLWSWQRSINRHAARQAHGEHA